MDPAEVATERTTAATNVLLAIVSVYLARALLSHQKSDSVRARIWALTFAGMAIAGGLGVIVHGFELSDTAHRLWWILLHLVLGITVWAFIAGVSYDLGGETMLRRLVPVAVVVGIGSYAATVVAPNSPVVFRTYEFAAAVYGLGVYVHLATSRQAPGAWQITAALVISVIAAGLEASGPFSFDLVWEFDHNGAFHVVQTIGLVMLGLGVERGFRAST